MSLYRTSIRWLLAGVVMLAAAIASFAAGAPTVVGGIFLALMVACGVVALIFAARFQKDARAWARSVKNQD
jgi:Ca2+/Na+ antiporter